MHIEAPQDMDVTGGPDALRQDRKVIEQKLKDILTKMRAGTSTCAEENYYKQLKFVLLTRI